MLKLSEKDIKIAMKNIVHYLQYMTVENMNNRNNWVENFNRPMEHIKTS